MVGDEIRTGSGPAELTSAELAAAELAARPARGLRRRGRGMGRRSRADVRAAGQGAGGGRAGAAGRPGLVLDLGAGACVARRAALAAGARQVVGADLSEGMLRHSRATLRAAWFPVAADAVALPFRDGSFDLVVAAFCLNHLSSLAAGLAEARRVGAAIAASLFAPGWTHPAKDAVDEAVRSFGYRPPRGYTALAPGSRGSDPDVLAECAAAAGFTRVRARTTDVPTGLATPAELASWRLGMAHFAPFLGSLDAPGRAAVRRAAEQAVARVASGAGAGPMRPLVVSMTMLTAS